MSAYQGILFPDRAESIKQFKGYRVFLDHWNPLAVDLRTYYEGLALRHETRCLAVHGPQGSGKTLFAQKLVEDFQHAKTTLAEGVPAPSSDDNNLWHRMTGGSQVSADLIRTATLNTEMLHIEDDKDWVNKAKLWRTNNKSRHCIIIADNAERAYFRQSLVALTDVEFINHGDTQATITLAAQRFVALCRSDLRGCLFLVLSNNDLFLLGFEAAIDSQHKGLMSLRSIPLPGSRDKETVVRVNTNRLNPISYWYCLDKAGPDEKSAVFSALNGASTFPDSFAAVDTAIRKSTRIGRPANKCTLSLIVFTNSDSVSDSILSTIGEIDRTELDHKWLKIAKYKSHWAVNAQGNSSDVQMLESEWQLRIIVLGNSFVSSLLSGDLAKVAQCTALLRKLETVHGVGTHQPTRDAHAKDLTNIIDSWPATSIDMTPFWNKNQGRSTEYEAVLARAFPNYNSSSDGFLTYRPDVVINSYRPCRILAANSPNIEDINTAIRRDAHVFEFTAIKDLDSTKIQGYLKTKIQNYIEVVREQ
jgi:hypothetical protein